MIPNKKIISEYFFQGIDSFTTVEEDVVFGKYRHKTIKAQIEPRIEARAPNFPIAYGSKNWRATRYADAIIKIIRISCSHTWDIAVGYIIICPWRLPRKMLVKGMSKKIKA